MRTLIYLLDSVMLFAYPTAKCNWENRALALLLIGMVALFAVYAR